MKVEDEFNIISISVISQKIHREGYPKLRIYLSDVGMKEDPKEYVNHILRVIGSN